MCTLGLRHEQAAATFKFLRAERSIYFNVLFGETGALGKLELQKDQPAMLCVGYCKLNQLKEFVIFLYHVLLKTLMIKFMLL